MTVRELITKFSFSTDTSGLRKYEQAVSKARKITLLTATAITGAAAGLLKLGSDAEETGNKFRVTFNGALENANRVAQDLANNYGLTSQKSKELLSDTGDLLRGFGFSAESALEMSEQVNKLAVDLASFTNFSGGAEGASQALTKALLGERESIKSLSIAILEEDVKAKMLELRKKGLRFETERQAKAQATLLLAFEQSENAIGDFNRSTGTLKNSLVTLKARVMDIATEVGSALVPEFNKLVLRALEFVKANREVLKQNMIEFFQNFIKSVSSAVNFIGRIIDKMGGFAKIAQTTGKVLSILAKVIIPLIAAITALDIALKIMAANPIALAIAGIVAGLTLLILNFDTVKKVANSAWTSIKNISKTIFGGLWKGIKAIGNALAQPFVWLWDALKGLKTTLDDNVAPLLAQQWEEFKQITKPVVDWFIERLEAIRQGYEDIKKWASEALKPVIDVANNIENAFDNAFDNIEDSASNALKSIKGFFGFGEPETALRKGTLSGGSGSTTTNNNTSNTNVNPVINIMVSGNTTPEQVENIKKAVREEVDKIGNQLNSNTPAFQ